MNVSLFYFNVILLKITEQYLKPEFMDSCFVSLSGDLCSILQESCPLAVSIGTATGVFFWNSSDLFCSPCVRPV